MSGARPVLLVRHAEAGVRGTWPGDDLDRELSTLGHAQARRLATTLPELGGRVAAIASSRAVRCTTTVQPLADAHGVEVVVEPLLLEGSDPAEVLAWLEGTDAPSVACSHGDVIGGVLELLADRGVAARPLRYPKAGTWVLERDADHRVRAARFESPPSTAE